MPESRVRTVLSWAVIVLVAGPVGTAVVLGFAFGESPCILCWAQRTSMALMALTGLFVLRYGPRPRYLGTVVILGTWGVFMALRHSALHLARDIGQGFAGAFFGAHTYVWAWFIHRVVLWVLGVLLILLREDTVETGARDLRGPERFAAGLFVVVIAANALQAFITTGPPPFMGQADPLRFSWNPARWVWLPDDELGGAVSLRGSWTVPAPDPAFVEADPDPASGPLGAVSTLPVLRWEEMQAPLEGHLTDLAFDPGSGRFMAVTERHGVHVLDPGLSRVEHSVTLDPHFAVELTPLSGAAFIGDTLAVVATNKSYALLRPDPEADEDYEWRHFLQTTGGMSELRRSRLATVRARQQYVLAAAYDRVADELITVSVPSSRHPRWVVSRFDRRDLVLSSEFLPEPGPELDLAGPDRSLGEYVVTGATVEDGRLYLVSAAHSTVLIVDPTTRAVTEAFGVPGLEQPVGIAVRGGEWLIAQADGRVAVVRRPERPEVPEPPA
ncbi:MAG: disulfide bond formation protein B [Gemmatimonadota bacterium]